MNGWNTPDDLDHLQGVGVLVIGAAVLRHRLGRGMSQRQLAWRVGLSQSTISRLEHGTLRGIGFRRLSAIAAVLAGAGDFRFADGPRASKRRLPGQEVLPSGNDGRRPSPFE